MTSGPQGSKCEDNFFTVLCGVFDRICIVPVLRREVVADASRNPPRRRAPLLDPRPWLARKDRRAAGVAAEKSVRQEGADRASWSAVVHYSKRRPADSLAPSRSLWMLDLDP